METTVPEVMVEGEAAEPLPRAQFGHFMIERMLGAGGMGVVLAARDVTLGRPVALKLVRPGAGEKSHGRLLREAQTLARLSHPNVVTVYEVGEVGGKLFIAMELVESEGGATLREWMQQERPWRQVVARFVAAGKGLAAVHELGLVHRDFKPSNVLIDRSGAVKVGDFGLVAAEDGKLAQGSGVAPRVEFLRRGAVPALTTVGTLVGTPQYMSPEQSRGDRVDARADQYSFCVSLHEALTGALPGGDGRPIPRSLRAVLLRGLQNDPARRYPSMAMLLGELERVLHPPVGRWATIAIGLLAAAAAVVAFSLVSSRGAPALPPTRQSLPADPAARAQVERIAAETARLEQRRRDGDYDDLPRRVAAVVEQARAANHAPTLVSALTVLAAVQSGNAEPVAAEATLREITQLAAAAHEDEHAANAWLKLVLVVGYDLGKPQEAVGLLAAAEAAVARAGSPLELRVDLLIYSAQLYDTLNRASEGLAKLAEARRLLTGEGAPAPGTTRVAVLGDIALEEAEARSSLGDHEGALAAGREAIAVYRRVYGPDHPDEAYPWHNMGEELRLLGRKEEAIAALQEAVRIRESKSGETPNLAISLSSLASALEEAGRVEEALQVLDRAVRISREKMSPDDPARVASLISLASVYSELKRWDAKLALEDEVLAEFARSGVKSENLAITLWNRGDSEAVRGRWAAALEFYNRSIAVIEEVSGRTFSLLVFPLEARGRALLQLRRPAEALETLERAVALSIPGRGRREQASARFLLGRAVIESGGNRADGLEQARRGHDELCALAPDDPATAAAAAWLARQR